MYVRKFEAETLEEALKAIKKEMGPDAIILKTVNNKGLKGAFKKSKIEITAAISETNYVKKAKVDNVLSDDQKETFYSDNSINIKKTIDSHDNYSEKANSSNAYAKLGVNRQVRSVKNEDQVSSGLDAFLNAPTPEPAQDIDVRSNSKLEDALKDFADPIIEEIHIPRPEPVQPISRPTTNVEVKDNSVVEELSVESQAKIDILEQQVYELKKLVDNFQRTEPVGLYQLRATLRALDISEQYILGLIRKATFDLSEEEQQNSDVVFEYALREMIEVVKTDMPLFSKVDDAEKPVITVLLSEMSSGQTSMLLKLGVLKDDAVLVQKKRKNQAENVAFYEKIFGIKVVQVETVSEVATVCRNAHSEGNSVIVDFAAEAGGFDETKKIIDGFRRSFANVEVLISLSSIHSELYNRKVVSLYKSLVDGIVVSHLDMCLNFGALFNLSEAFGELPFKFFGTGIGVPDDLEAATAERILAGMFHL